MNTKTLICTLALLFACLTVPAGARPVIDDGLRAKIDGYIASALAAPRTPGCCLVIGTKDQILFAKAYGHLTYEPDSPAVTLDTLYDMASCTKVAATATTFAFLLQDGKVELDDPVSKYLPAWNRDDKRAITIRNLVTHTSGLQAYANYTDVEASRKPGESHPDALINYIASLPLQYETGKGSIYSCLNFLTLARVNEEVLGTSQERFLRAKVFEPLGMSNSGYYLRSSKKKLCAPTIGGKEFRQGVVHDPLACYYRDGYHCPGNAGLFTTANDISKFCQMILSNGKWDGKQILESKTVDMFFTNQAPESSNSTRGLAWELADTRPYPPAFRLQPKTACITHTGYTGTLLEIDRYAGTFIVFLTNRVYPDDNGIISPVRDEIRQAVIDADPVYKSAAVTAKH